MQVYVNKDGQQYGPFTVEQLRHYVHQGNFTTADYACCDGQNWITIAQVPGFAAAAPAPQSQVRQTTVGKPSRSPAANTRKVVAADKKKKVVLWSSIGGGVLVVAAVLVWMLGSEDDKVDDDGESPASSDSASEKEPDLDDPKVRAEIAEQGIDFDSIEFRKVGVVYLLFYLGKPHTGWVKKMHDNGQVRYLCYCVDGKRSGWQSGWHENGRKSNEYQWKEGQTDGRWTNWYESGQKQFDSHYANGKLVSAVSWKPSGEKCPHTNVVNGNGVQVLYGEDGAETVRWIYKAGEMVK